MAQSPPQGLETDGMGRAPSGHTGAPVAPHSEIRNHSVEWQDASDRRRGGRRAVLGLPMRPTNLLLQSM
jgi:hypothetical protein